MNKEYQEIYFRKSWFFPKFPKISPSENFQLYGIRHTIYRHLFSDFLPFHSPVKEKGKQVRMKGLTMVQWIINLNQTTDLCQRVNILFCEKKLALSFHYQWVLQQRGRQAGRRNTGGFQNFKTSLQVELFGFLFYLILLQFYCSIKTAFSRLLSS